MNINNTANLKIIPMNYSHIDDVYQLNQVCFSSEAWSKKSIEYELTCSYAITFVAVLGDNTVGFISAKSLLGECYINNVGVDTEYRRFGVAHALLSALIELCKQKGDDFITLEVRKSNEPASMLYHKFDFVEVGQRKNFYTKPTEDALLLTLELK